MLEQKENVYDWREVRSQVHDCNMTMAELLELWMAANSYNVKLSTSERYHFVIERHILPELGRIPVCEMTPEILENFVDYKLRYGRLDGKGGMSPKSVNDICMIIKSALKLARRRYSYNGADMEEVIAREAAARELLRKG